MKNEKKETQNINGKMWSKFDNDVVIIEFNVNQVSDCYNRYFFISLKLNKTSKVLNLKEELKFFLLE